MDFIPDNRVSKTRTVLRIYDVKRACERHAPFSAPKTEYLRRSLNRGKEKGGLATQTSDKTELHNRIRCVQKDAGIKDFCRLGVFETHGKRACENFILQKRVR